MYKITVFALQFVDSARQVCEGLRDQGYWADFVDPASGRPVSRAYYLINKLAVIDK